MKQCPNPNCIMYTRLEELPDTYVRCPRCGGQVVDADMPSTVLSSGHLTSNPPSYVPLTSADQYEDDDQQLPPGPQSQGDEYDYDDGYGYAEDADGYGYTLAPPKRSKGMLGGLSGKIGIVAGTVLALVVCAALALLLGGRFLPQNKAVGSPQATETVLSSLRPPVNTPISILPTIPAVGFAAPTANLSKPTLAPLLPTATQPIVVAIPTPAVPPGPSNAKVMDARMSVRFVAGQPVGEVSAYNSTGTFNLAVQANFGAGGVTSLLTRWFGPDGKQIYEMKKDYSQPGAYYVGFTLNKSAPWATGEYHVDIYPNNSPTPADTVTFTVVP